jgi:hypothetical protein
LQDFSGAYLLYLAATIGLPSKIPPGGGPPRLGSVDIHVGVEVEGQRLAFDEHGVEFEGGEGEGVAGGGGGVDEEFAHEVGGVHLHLGGEFAGEEGDEQEVEFAVVGEALDAGVAEADGFALGLRDEGDVGIGGHGDSDTRSVDGGPELGAGVDVDDDAVVLEGDVGVVGVDVAGRMGVAAHVVAAIGSVEELCAEGALEGLGGDLDLDGASGCGGQEEGTRQKVEQGRGLHGFKDKA